MGAFVFQLTAFMAKKVNMSMLKMVQKIVKDDFSTSEQKTKLLLRMLNQEVQNAL